MVQYRIEFNMRVELPLILMNAYFLQQNYLERYGYLSPADVEIGKTKLNSGKVSDAVRKLQHFAGLNETGNPLDPSTVELVTKQRCGFRDLGNTAQFKRRRRYALHGTWWRKHVSHHHVRKTEVNCAFFSVLVYYAMLLRRFHDEPKYRLLHSLRSKRFQSSYLARKRLLPRLTFTM